eukprot:Plantae.Rhodophyta-Hildenbrandia_rubra.ctg8536.p1 GENE.Plantae.Rhodophyta-Hildenbrandia_rubra.ctg8536~~Plantae.Rhodophyta-Hildenbrandia_rubra.ctg8536.p1  ORF type:complete len:487 (-),score=48.39 Plantae.Rhodophyta-Hildenbrandia_rubra.ctg8536:528-1988(-)
MKLEPRDSSSPWTTVLEDLILCKVNRFVLNPKELPALKVNHPCSSESSHDSGARVTSLMSMSPQHGLEWKSSLLGFEPSWTIEPRIDVVEDIARQKLGQPQSCSVEFFSQGGFNKLYVVRCEKGEFMMRVSLPVDPWRKTLSEVSTIDFVRQNTDIPVPKIVAFDASKDNELGFEWILMERMPGKPLVEHWRTMSLTTKQALVKRLALFAAQLFRKRFHLLGNLYHSDEHAANCVGASAQTISPSNFIVDRVVSMEFFWADHIDQDAPRGPFKSSREWLSARLLFHQNDSEGALRASKDEDDLEDARNIAQNAQKLLSLLPLVFQSCPEERLEQSALKHDDLSQQNILVDQDGNLTAVVDWECVSLMPLWKVCQLPALLEGRERSDVPVKDSYVVDKNGEVSELFWEHLLEYEQTQLRGVFLDEVQRIEPAWVEIYSANSNKRKAEFELAIHHSDNIFCIKDIEKWLDEIARGGEVSSLRKLLAGC